MKKDAITFATLFLIILTFLFVMLLIAIGFFFLILDFSFFDSFIIIVFAVPFILSEKHLIDCYKYLIERIAFPKYRKVRIFNNVIRHIFLGFGCVFFICIFVFYIRNGVFLFPLLTMGIPSILCFMYFFILRAINKKLYELELFYTE